MPWSKEALRVKSERRKTGNTGNTGTSTSTRKARAAPIGDGSVFNRLDDPFNICNGGNITVDIDDETGDITI